MGGARRLLGAGSERLARAKYILCASGTPLVILESAPPLVPVGPKPGP